MASAWGQVMAHEATSGRRFDRIVFSRPDVRYHTPFGPWCLYRKHVWYTGGDGAPDFFWIMPRDVAKHVLGATLHTFLHCAPGEPCCAGLAALHARRGWLHSWWALKYWTSRLEVNISTHLHGRASCCLWSASDQARESEFDSRTNPKVAHLGCGAPNCGTRASSDAEGWSVEMMRATQDCHDVRIFEL